MKSIDENQKRNRVEIWFAVKIWSLKKRQNGSVVSPRYSCFTVIRSRQARLIISTHISTQMEELQKIGSIRLSKGTVWFLCFTIFCYKKIFVFGCVQTFHVHLWHRWAHMPKSAVQSSACWLGFGLDFWIFYAVHNECPLFRFDFMETSIVNLKVAARIYSGDNGAFKYVFSFHRNRDLQMPNLNNLSRQHLWKRLVIKVWWRTN